MNTVGQREILTQQRVLAFFRDFLGYTYLGDWQDRPNNRNIESDLLTDWRRSSPICSSIWRHSTA